MMAATKTRSPDKNGANCRPKNQTGTKTSPVEQTKSRIYIVQYSLFETGVNGTKVIEFPRIAEENPEFMQLSFFETGVKNAVVYETSRIAVAAKADGPKDWRKIFEDNILLVKAQVSGIIGANSNNRDDLEQAGLIALMKCAKKFDPDKGYQFSSYAVPAIKRAMIREQRMLRGKFETQSIEVMNEESSSAIAQVTEPVEASPCAVTEKDEIVEMLLNISQTLRREKERKGVLALARQLQGYNSDFITHEAGIAKNSYSALVSAGRRVLQANPHLLNYISVVKSESQDEVVANLLGTELKLSFTKDAVFDVPSDRTPFHKYLEILAETMCRDGVAEYLLDEVRIGESVYVMDGDNKCMTGMIMGTDKVEVTHMKKTNRPLLMTA